MIFFVLFTPCFPEISTNITIISPHLAISSSNFNIGTIITARVIDSDQFHGWGQAGNQKPGTREKFRRKWTFALNGFINTKSNIILLQHFKKYLFNV